MRRIATILCLAAALPALAEERPIASSTSNDFSGKEDATPFVFRKRGKPAKPETKEGRLQLLFGRAEQKSSAAFPRTGGGAYRRVDAAFRATLSGQNEGFCFALPHTGRFDQRGMMWDPQPARRTDPAALRTPDWAEPNLADSFAVGFDVRNPKDEDWFNANGNYYGRPEREVSLHWDGVEVANTLCETEISTGEPVEFSVKVMFVAGGAEVTVQVGETKVYDRRFVPHMLPYECRVGFGAHGTGEMFLDDVKVAFSKPVAPPPPPIVVPALNRAWVHKGKGQNRVEREVELLPAAVEAERIILTVTYDGPMHRDFWDRKAAVYAWDDEGTRFELARVTTPFMLWNTRYAYHVDVTRFAPLLYGKRKLGVMVGSNVARGFLVDVTLTYYRRPPDVEALPKTIALQNLWSGNAHFNKKGHVAEFFSPREITVPKGAKRAYVRIVVSGHGVMEFTKISRTLKVNGKEFQNELWRTDCYLNPYRPQFGTWKFDRAGWAPGAVVEPWIVDVSDQIDSGKLAIRYESAPFDAEKWANHWVEAQIFFVR